MVSSNVEYLRAYGPGTMNELPNTSVSAADRRNGVWKLEISGYSAGTRLSRGTATPVYYLKNRHDETEVVERYFDANSQLFELPWQSLAMLFGRQGGDEWQDAAREVYEDYHDTLLVGVGRRGGYELSSCPSRDE